MARITPNSYRTSCSPPPRPSIQEDEAIAPERAKITQTCCVGHEASSRKEGTNTVASLR